jgi:hypothetical protein
MAGPSPSSNDRVSPESVSPYRRWFRFSLRTLLILMTVLGVWLGFTVHRVRLQSRAVQAIEAAGGQIAYDSRFDFSHELTGGRGDAREGRGLRPYITRHFFDDVVRVEVGRFDLRYRKPDVRIADVAPYLPDLAALKSLTVSHSRTGSSELAAIGKLKRLDTLIFFEGELSTPEAVNLRSLTKLRELGMNNVRMVPKSTGNFRNLPALEHAWIYGYRSDEERFFLGDETVSAFVSCPNLRHFALINARVTDDGMASLGGATQLKRLTIGSPLVTDAAMEHVAKLTNLDWLGVWSWRISNDSLARLQELPDLIGLEIFDTPITNDGLRHVGKLDKLETLRLSGQLFDDSGLKELGELKNLKALDLSGTSIRSDSEGVKVLQKSLPNCKIGTADQLSRPFR